MSAIQQFDFTLNLLDVLLWQYNEAVRIKSLLTQKNAFYQKVFTQFFNDWMVNVFNLITANDFGLTVWSFILDLPLFLEPGEDPPGKPIFGFNQTPPINNNVNFNNGNFSTGNAYFGFTTEEKRLLLRLRYFQLISRGSTYQTNQMLASVFQSLGRVYVLDGLNMTITVVFLFEVSTALVEALKKYDLIPRPSGVLIKYIQNTGVIFGFNQTPPINNNVNFTNGNFAPII